MDQNYASASRSMDPPKLPQPAQRHSKNEWEALRSLITRMYTTERAKLPDIRDTLEKEHSFVVKQLKEKVRLWNLEKNVKKNEMDYILRKQQQRLSKGKIVKFRIRKQPVPQSKIKRFEKQEASRSEMLDSRGFLISL
ncbi:hypothetical protein IFR04_001941 [Cadophora malorum]|uniref:Clr5 domain-containing protein n=1 Tax=Cadophora malorum TaxID=108018 RepID=A0A8H8BUV8_9HELO|nr:hypothetical protein IFR04_001941 [Cadophora malorum]